jgi:hypothetical protein
MARLLNSRLRYEMKLMATCGVLVAYMPDDPNPDVVAGTF